VKKDTVRVEVWAAGLNSVNGQAQEYMIAPNPNNGVMQLLQAVEDSRPVRVEVFEVTGKRIYATRASFSNGRWTMQLQDMAAGMYYMAVHDYAGHCYTLKFVKQ
jgi:hypothetical protein